MPAALCTWEVCLYPILLFKKQKKNFKVYEFGSIPVPHVFFSSVALWFLLLSPHPHLHS